MHGYCQVNNTAQELQAPTKIVQYCWFLLCRWLWTFLWVDIVHRIWANCTCFYLVFSRNNVNIPIISEMTIAIKPNTYRKILQIDFHERVVIIGNITTLTTIWNEVFVVFNWIELCVAQWKFNIGNLIYVLSWKRNRNWMAHILWFEIP